ncbi:MAG: murein biosynthesis integral membrane protein MurJ [Puniceicoccales bacterium]|jgi:putative peptidoglycan lipid II flippase|nr:murein biosynthesis integral membrane protein MurJ [Puniceicoccales bacterium]
MANSGESSIVALALTTAASRIMGLFRDMVIFMLLGISQWSGAFLFAFTVPNLFRRLLGEGALASAMIPVYGEALAAGNIAETHRFFNGVLSRLSVLLCAAVGLVSLVIFTAWPLLNAHWMRAFGLCILLFPYLPCASISALFCGALNVHNSFALPAFTATLLNLSIIGGGLCAIIFFQNLPFHGTLLLCFGVLGGGFLQVLFPWILLRRTGWRFHWNWVADDRIARISRLFTPAVMGAAIVQINAAISRTLAYCFTANGLPLLYISSRLVELPIGIFMASIASVAFPQLTRKALQDDERGFFYQYYRAQWSVLMIAIPCTMGLVALGRPILQLLFQRGNFSADSVVQAVPILAVSAIGIPFYSIHSIATRAFHARQDMKTPLRIALWTVALNFLGTLLSLKLWGTLGIVLANGSTALLQCLWLHGRLRQMFVPKNQWHRTLRFHCLPLCISSLLLALALYGSHCIGGMKIFQSLAKLNACIELFSAISTGAIAYIVPLYLFRFPEVSLLTAFFKIFAPSSVAKKAGD